LNRMLDANLNRCREGVRVLEDVARFVLDDVHLSERIRSIRHRVWELGSLIGAELVASRDSRGDVERDARPEVEGKRSEVVELVIANAKRAQEAARVLEEVLKLRSPSLWKGFKEVRFELYDLEKELLLRLLGKKEG
jgi:thiamine-phosphate pyrophosphorylase